MNMNDKFSAGTNNTDISPFALARKAQTTPKFPSPISKSSNPTSNTADSTSGSAEEKQKEEKGIRKGVIWGAGTAKEVFNRNKNNNPITDIKVIIHQVLSKPKLSTNCIPELCPKICANENAIL